MLRPPSSSLPPLVPGIERRTVLAARELGVAAVRIPALLRCRDGRIVVFAEARREGAGDTGPIEVIARTSADGTRWADPVVVATAPGRTMGNPVPIEAGDGAIVLLTTSNDAAVHEAEILAGSVPAASGRRVHLTRLSPDLARIGTCQDLTDQVKDPAWDWYATGPGHGVALADGRLVAAANHSRRDPDGRPHYAAHGLLSEDDGHSWSIAWTARSTAEAASPNESALALAPADGAPELLVTCRSEDPAGPRTRSIGRIDPALLRAGTALEATGRFAALAGFAGPRIQAGLAAAPPSLPGTGPRGGSGEAAAPEALLSAPVRAAARRDLVLHAIAGSACRPLALLHPGPAGYSDLAVADGEILVLVETGQERTHERIDLLRADLADIAAAVRPAPSKEQTP
ncbi:exo-alpha-sialidase [Brachybacterium phenoliresistens]|uniref:exo-alpha-sialidase n=1 Tax=Brachybacterium phenoliresistens TaxID=396014 RepID=UPI0018DC847A|nr:sialidase family protein [Brachybacterium phenoliresistens]